MLRRNFFGTLFGTFPEDPASAPAPVPIQAAEAFPRTVIISAANSPGGPEFFASSFNNFIRALIRADVDFWCDPYPLRDSDPQASLTFADASGFHLFKELSADMISRINAPSRSAPHAPAAQILPPRPLRVLLPAAAATLPARPTPPRCALPYSLPRLQIHLSVADNRLHFYFPDNGGLSDEKKRALHKSIGDFSNDVVRHLAGKNLTAHTVFYEEGFGFVLTRVPNDQDSRWCAASAQTLIIHHIVNTYGADWRWRGSSPLRKDGPHFEPA